LRARAILSCVEFRVAAGRFRRPPFIKSYGRAPTFVMATGYEQVRSVTAHLAGDSAAANEVRLVLR
jgi:hypothetical protein